MNQKAIDLLDSWSEGDDQERKETWEAIKHVAAKEQVEGLQLLEFEAYKACNPFDGQTRAANDLYLPLAIDMKFLYGNKHYRVTAKDAQVTIKMLK